MLRQHGAAGHGCGMRGSTLVRRFSEETIAFGGLPLRRGDAARIALAWAYCPGEMDRFVWAKPALTDSAPLALACAAVIMGLSPAVVGTQ